MPSRWRSRWPIGRAGTARLVLGAVDGAPLVLRETALAGLRGGDVAAYGPGRDRGFRAGVLAGSADDAQQDGGARAAAGARAVITMPLTLTVNGEAVSAQVEPRMHLGDFLREHLRLTATHLGCEHGVCGACTVLIGGEPARACITLAVSRGWRRGAHARGARG